MEVKAVRVFYQKADNEIVWRHTLTGTGEFANTKEEDLAGIPDTMPNGETPLGGVPEDYACIEVTDQTTISAFMASDSNTVVNGELITGTPRPIVIPVESPDVIALKKYLADPHSGLPDLETAFQALARLYLGVK